MRSFEQHSAALPDRRGINPFTKQPLIIKGRPARMVSCDLEVAGAVVRTSFSWFEGGILTAGPHTDERALADASAAERHALEVAADLVADGFREVGAAERPAPPQPPGELTPDGAAEARASALANAVADSCRRRRWFGADLNLRFAAASAPERRGFRYARATASEIAETERRVGFPLPPLLRGLYMEVASGGFGPGYGLVGAVGGASADMAENIADAYRIDRSRDSWLEESDCEPGEDGWFQPFYDEWPGGVLRLVHWGCAIWSCLDVRRGRVLRYEHFHGKRTREAMMVEAASIEEWVDRWLAGHGLF